MRDYHGMVIADKYPTEFVVKASNVHTAAARIMKLWQKRFKGSQPGKWTITIIRGSEIKTEE